VVAIVDDQIDEANETFTVTLANGTNATIGDPTATGTINDDDAVPSLTITGADAAEGAGSVVFTVTLSGASGRGVTVDYATSEGSAGASDFTSTSGTLTI